MNCLVIGGGIIGLSSAYYLAKSGHKVLVVDQTNMQDGCSYGNAGYVCPSHFIPMATPGIVSQGLKWMLDSRSPFYVEPRFSSSLADWGLKFIKSATAANVEKAAIPLRDIAVLSQHLYENDWMQDAGLKFTYERKGLLEIFQSEVNAIHSQKVADKARALGLEVELLDRFALQSLEPGVEINALGAIWFKCDAHLSPPILMRSLKLCLKNMGVEFRHDTRVSGFSVSGDKITKVIAGNQVFDAEAVVMATGSWSRELAASLRLKIPLVAGRGYSITYENTSHQLNYPSVLMEGRVATTPLGAGSMRFGGTMEITSTNRPARLRRVEGILATVKKYYPSFDLPFPEKDKIWFGYRPCSADGLPYIGKVDRLKNFVIATGHSMLGLSLGAGTGKLVAELLNEQSTSISVAAFRPDRFN